MGHNLDFRLVYTLRLLHGVVMGTYTATRSEEAGVAGAPGVDSPPRTDPAGGSAGVADPGPFAHLAMGKPLAHQWCSRFAQLGGLVSLVSLLGAVEASASCANGAAGADDGAPGALPRPVLDVLVQLLSVASLVLRALPLVTAAAAPSHKRVSSRSSVEGGGSSSSSSNAAGLAGVDGGPVGPLATPAPLAPSGTVLLPCLATCLSLLRGLAVDSHSATAGASGVGGSVGSATGGAWGGAGSAEDPVSSMCWDAAVNAMRLVVDCCRHDAR